MKRSNGEGSIYQLPSGLWCAVTPPPRVARVHKMKRIALERRDVVMRKRGAGIAHIGPQQKWKDYLPSWLEIHEQHVKATTFRRDKRLLELHTAPLDDKRIDKIETKDVQAILTAESAKLAPATVSEIRRLIVQSLNMAVEWKLLGSNPAKVTKAPRIGRRIVVVPSQDERKAFRERIRGDRDECLFLIYYLAGSRRGEPLGMSWDEINWENGSITFNKGLQRVGKKLALTSLKTDASTRTFRPGARVIALLKARKRQQAEERLKAGPAWVNWNDADLVFTTATGTPREPRNILRKIKTMGMKNVHLLRHSATTEMLRQKLSIKGIQRTLGWSSAKMMYDVYAHLIEDDSTEIADAMEAMGE